MDFPEKPQDKKLVYLDHAATTYTDDRVVEAMQPFFVDQFANPSGLYAIGREVNGALNDARRKVAEILHTLPDTIIFTGGGTESDNLAILGVARKYQDQGKHIITSKIEHHAVLHTCEALEKQGFDVTYLEPDSQGFVSPKKVYQALREDTILVSVMYANNEIGTLQPTREIGEIAASKNIAFHTDAVASEGLIPIDVQKDQIGLLSLSSNDIYGPKGVGVLYKKENLALLPHIIGGGQENGLRSGSENIPGIVGMKIAAEIANEEGHQERIRLIQYRDRLIKEILATIPKSHLNGHPTDRLPNNAHFRFDAIEGESILLSFKDQNIAVSTGSACSSKTLEPSHTLIATGLLHEEAHGSLELTSGRFTQDSDVERVLEVTPGIVKRLRALSPLYKE